MIAIRGKIHINNKVFLQHFAKKLLFHVDQAERKMLLRDLMIVVAVVERRKGNLKPNADSLVRIEL